MRCKFAVPDSEDLQSVRINTNPKMLNPNKLKHFYIIGLIILVSCNKKDKEVALPKKDFCASIHRNDNLTLSKELESYSKLMQTKTGVYVLEDGGGSLVTRAWLTEFARSVKSPTLRMCLSVCD